MNDRVIDLLLAVGAASTVAFAIDRWQGSLPSQPSYRLPRAAQFPDSSDDVRSMDDIANATIARNPFRLSNRPADVRHGETPPVEAVTAPSYRPTLTLKAIIGGPPWRALVGGVPNARGFVMVSEGDNADSIRVLRITSDTVHLAGPDTTWALVLARRPE
jgi:hypothetical protein